MLRKFLIVSNLLCFFLGTPLILFILLALLAMSSSQDIGDMVIIALILPMTHLVTLLCLFNRLKSEVIKTIFAVINAVACVIAFSGIVTNTVVLISYFLTLLFGFNFLMMAGLAEKFSTGNNRKKTQIVVFTLLLFVFYQIIQPYTVQRKDINKVEPVAIFSGGLGTGRNPYLIATSQDLIMMARFVKEGNLAQSGDKRDFRSAYYLQVDHIDLSEISKWTPIGAEDEHAFTGVYDGDSYRISNIHFGEKTGDNPIRAYGLFGIVRGNGDSEDIIRTGVIKNVNLENAFSHVKTSQAIGAFGAIVGYVENGGIINCSSRGGKMEIYLQSPDIALSGDYRIGGLVGQSKRGYVDNCINARDISVRSDWTGSNKIIGGIIGDAFGDYSSVSEDYHSRDQYLEGHVRVVESRNEGNIDVPEGGLIGGIAGRVTTGYLEDCANTGYIRTSSGGTVGEIVGKLLPDNHNQGNTAVPASGQSREKKHLVTPGANFKKTWQAQPNLIILNHDSFPANFSGGRGSKENPYLISKAGDLIVLSKLVPIKPGYSSAYYRQTADIDLASSPEWTPIGTIQNSFSGLYDGANHKISNIHCNENTESSDTKIISYGLFGYTKRAVLKNIHMVNAFSLLRYGGIPFPRDMIVGTDSDGVMLVKEDMNIGTIAGSALGGSIENCSSRGNTMEISCFFSKEIKMPGTFIGGIVGRFYGGGIIKNCVNSRALSIRSTKRLFITGGGIAGAIAGGAVVMGCRNEGRIDLSATSKFAKDKLFASVGGIAGRDYRGYRRYSTIDGFIPLTGSKMRGVFDSTNAGDISIQRCESAEIGGLFGSTRVSQLLRSYNRGNIQVTSGGRSIVVGGLAGYLTGKYSVMESMNSGNISVKIDYKDDGLPRYFEDLYPPGRFESQYPPARFENFVGVYCGGIAGVMNESTQLVDVGNTGNIAGRVSSKPLSSMIYFGSIAGIANDIEDDGIISFSFSRPVRGVYEDDIKEKRRAYVARRGMQYLKPISLTRVFSAGQLNLVNMPTDSSCDIAGIVGFVSNMVPIKINDSYWLEGSGANKGVGLGEYNTEDSSIKLTNQQFAKQESFSGWDFKKIWTIPKQGGKTPVLRALSKE